MAPAPGQAYQDWGEWRTGQAALTEAFQPPQAQKLTFMVTAETQEECSWSDMGANRADSTERGSPKLRASPRFYSQAPEDALTLGLRFQEQFGDSPTFTKRLQQK